MLFEIQYVRSIQSVLQLSKLLYMTSLQDQYVFLNQCAMDIIRSRTGTNVDLIYQNAAALSIYENVERKKGFPKKGYHNA